MNITEVLIEEFHVRPEEIAAKVGASYSAVRNWHKGRAEPLTLYQERLVEMLRKEREKVTEVKKVS